MCDKSNHKAQINKQNKIYNNKKAGALDKLYLYVFVFVFVVFFVLFVSLSIIKYKYMYIRCTYIIINYKESKNIIINTHIEQSMESQVAQSTVLPASSSSFFSCLPPAPFTRSHATTSALLPLEISTDCSAQLCYRFPWFN